MEGKCQDNRAWGPALGELTTAYNPCLVPWSDPDPDPHPCHRLPGAQQGALGPQTRPASDHADRLHCLDDGAGLLVWTDGKLPCGEKGEGETPALKHATPGAGQDGGRASREKPEDEPFVPTADGAGVGGGPGDPDVLWLDASAYWVSGKQSRSVGCQSATPGVTDSPPRRPRKPVPQQGSPTQTAADPAFSKPTGAGHSNPNHLCPGRPAARSGPGTQWCRQSSCFPGTGTSSLQQGTWDGCL